MQQHLRHDAQLRADVRAYYNDQRLFSDVPPFEQAERLRTPTYLEAVAVAQQDRLIDSEMEARRLQMALI